MKTRKTMIACALGLSLLLFGCASAKQQSQVDYIGAEAAKTLALEAAGLQASDVKFTSTELDSRNGLKYYEVEFTAAGQSYEYDIDALTGAVIEADTPTSAAEKTPVTDTSETLHTVESTQPTQPAPSTSPDASTDGTLLTEDEAKALALEHAGLTADQATFVKIKLENEKGRQVYDVEFYTSSSQEYDYEIDAATGEIVSFDYDAEASVPTTSSGSTITADDAKELALAQVPGATADDILEFKTDQEHGCVMYEGKIIYDSMEYEFEIDGYSGAICEWEAEQSHDSKSYR